MQSSFQLHSNGFDTPFSLLTHTHTYIYNCCVQLLGEIKWNKESGDTSISSSSATHHRYKRVRRVSFVCTYSYNMVACDTSCIVSRLLLADSETNVWSENGVSEPTVRGSWWLVRVLLFYKLCLSLFGKVEKGCGVYSYNNWYMLCCNILCGRALTFPGRVMTSPLISHSQRDEKKYALLLTLHINIAVRIVNVRKKRRHIV